MNTNVERWCNDTEVLEEKPVQIQLCPSHFPMFTELGSNKVILSDRSAVNLLTYGTPLAFVNTGMIYVVPDFLIGVYSFDHIYPVASSTVWKLLVLI